MSNYPPTPAFGGGFVPRQPLAPHSTLSKGHAHQPSSRAQPQPLVSAPMFTARLPSRIILPHNDTNGRATKTGPDGSMNGKIEVDREEGEVSDIEGELTHSKPIIEKAMSNACSVDLALVSLNPQGHMHGSDEAVNQATTPNGTLTRIPGLSSNVAEDINSSPTHTNFAIHGTGSIAHLCSHKRTGLASANQLHATNFARYDDIRKRAEAAVLNLLPLKVTFKDMVEEGISEKVLRRVFVKIGLPVPPEGESIAHHRDSSSVLKGDLHATRPSQNLVISDSLTREDKAEQLRKRLEEEKALKKRLAEGKERKQHEAMEPESKERQGKERQAKEREAKECEAKEREAKEHEAKERDAAQKFKEEEQKKKEELAKRELQTKRELLSKNADGCNLPSILPPLGAPNPSANSKPMPTANFHIPSPSVFNTGPVMIPGLLLDAMDIGPRFPEASISALTPVAPNNNLNSSDTYTAVTMAPPTAAVAAVDIAMKDAPYTSSPAAFISDSKVTPRRKRPVATDFDDDPVTTFSAPPVKRRFGSIREGVFVYNLTDDEEDEGCETMKQSTSPLDSLRAARTSRSPPKFGTSVDQQYAKDRNGNTPPGLLNDAVESAKQLKEKEETIRKLREKIQLMLEKKKKGGAAASESPGTPARGRTPSPNPGAAVPKGPQTGTPLQLKASGSVEVNSVSIAPDIVKDPNAKATSMIAVVPAPSFETASNRQGQAEDTSGINTPNLPTIEATPSAGSLQGAKETPQPPRDNRTKDELERLRALLLAKRKRSEAPNATSESEAMSVSFPPRIDAAPALPDELKGLPPTIQSITTPEDKDSSTPVSFDKDRISANGLPGEPAEEVEQTEKEQDASGYESPPYEPSLRDVEEAESISSKMEVYRVEEESVEMEVDSSDGESEEGQLEEKEIAKETGVLTPDEQKPGWPVEAQQPALESSPISAIIEPVTHLPSPAQTEYKRAHVQESANFTEVEGKRAAKQGDTTSASAKTIPNIFTEYESPLRQFRSYRYHPSFLEMVSGGYRSWTFSHRIDPEKEFCVYELNGGKCNDRSCQMQHFREISLSDDEILVELGSVFEGDSEADRAAYREGLREVIQNMRAHKVSDFQTVAAQISRYRTKFFNDPTRVVRLTKAEKLV